MIPCGDEIRIIYQQNKTWDILMSEKKKGFFDL